MTISVEPDIRELIQGHTAIKDHNGLCIPCGEIPLDGDHGFRRWFLNEFWWMCPCLECPYGEYTLTQWRYIWLQTQIQLMVMTNIRRKKAGLEPLKLGSIKAMPGDPDPQFWKSFTRKALGHG